VAAFRTKQDCKVLVWQSEWDASIKGELIPYCKRQNNKKTANVHKLNDWNRAW